jgi:hypothetical protein
LAKKKPGGWLDSTAATRQTRWRERLSAQGKQVLRLTLTVDAVQAIDQQRGETSRSEYVEALVLKRARVLRP